VAFGDISTTDQSDVPWQFDLPTAAGTYDLVTTFGPFMEAFDQIAIRRGVVVTGDLDVGPLDADTEHCWRPNVRCRRRTASRDGASARSSARSGPAIRPR
jgi:hypothetical protein